MILVTKNQYILASKIHHISLDEMVNHQQHYDKSGKARIVKIVNYVIHVIYSPENINTNNHNQNNDDQRECTVSVRHAVDAHALFADLITQIREQNPDQLYLDKALEKMLAGTDVKILAERDMIDDSLEDVNAVTKKRPNDRSAKKVRKSRKTKRSGKKVLRRSK